MPSHLIRPTKSPLCLKAPNDVVSSPQYVAKPTILSPSGPITTASESPRCNANSPLAAGAVASGESKQVPTRLEGFMSTRPFCRPAAHRYPLELITVTARAVCQRHPPLSRQVNKARQLTASSIRSRPVQPHLVPSSRHRGRLSAGRRGHPYGRKGVSIRIPLLCSWPRLPQFG